MKLPIPTLCPDERYRQRLSRRLPRELHQRNCAKCASEITTGYPQESSQKILCEPCFLKI